MIVPDTNLLLYAYNPDDRHHPAAKRWLEGILSSSEMIGFPVVVIHSFLRILTHPVIAGRLILLDDAAAIVDEWLSLPQVRILYPAERHWELLKSLAIEGNAPANLIPDAVIAAIALEHGGTVHTHDHGFARFPNLPCHYPLQA
jgi:toxin-antitoxin system PIN domain toxin